MRRGCLKRCILGYSHFPTPVSTQGLQIQFITIFPNFNTGWIMPERCNTIPRLSSYLNCLYSNSYKNSVGLIKYTIS